MLLAKLELPFVHVAVLVDADALTVPLVLEPLSVVLPPTCNLLPKSVPHTIEPLAIVDVLAILPF